MAASRSRIHILDELRGFCIVLMIFYHAFYTLGNLFDLSLAADLYRFFTPVQPFFAGIFIALCGFSCRLSRSNLKRGLLLAAVAAGLTGVTCFLSTFKEIGNVAIYFGILHCLAVCILLFALLKKPLSHLPTWLGLLVTAVLFVLTYGMLSTPAYIGIGGMVWHFPSEWVSNEWLAPLGIGYLYSADYFPLFPWVFCFLFGTFLGNYKDKFPKWTHRMHVRPLAFAGRHSLWFYIAHQPVIFGLATLIDLIM